MNSLTLVTFLGSLLTYTAITRAECGGPPGQYCSSTLEGYWDCLGDGGAGNFAACPVDTRCSCFLNRKCEEKAIICEAFDTPYPLKESFSVVYNGTEVITHPMGRSVRKLNGSVYQDGNKFFEKEFISDAERFTLILPHRSVFVKYEGNVSKRQCEASTVDSFQGFMSHISLFTKTDSEATDNESVKKEKWKFKNGPRHGGQSTRDWIWVVESNALLKSMRPLAYKYEYIGSNMVRESWTTTWDEIRFSEEIPNKQMFKIPSFCPQI